MEELKAILSMVQHLPTMALWVLVGYLVYQLAVIGSVYGVIRYVAGELFSWLRQKKIETKEIRPMLDGMCISGQLDPLIGQLHRLRGKGTNIQSNYIHMQSVEWLRQAIDAKEQEDMRERSRA